MSQRVADIRQDEQVSETLTMAVPSTRASLDFVMKSSEAFLRNCGTPETSRLWVVLRELLLNAITHGNGEDPKRAVVCRVERVAERQFRITVEDEGDGFDYRALDTALPDNPRALSKRGYILVRNICSSLEFNARGNRVTAVLSAPQ